MLGPVVYGRTYWVTRVVGSHSRVGPTSGSCGLWWAHYGTHIVGSYGAHISRAHVWGCMAEDCSADLDCWRDRSDDRENMDDLTQRGYPV